MTAKPIFASIQILRAIAALLVVIFHLRIVEGKNASGEPLLPQWFDFGDGGVDLFFVISGFVMITITAGCYQSPAGAGRFLAKRAWRILPPYWFYTTLAVILMAVVPAMVNSSFPNQGIIASYLLWPQAVVPVLAVGWTLIHEAYFYLVMAVIIATLPQRWLPGFLALWAILVGVIYTQAATPAPWLALISSPMTWEFIAGAFIGLYWRRLPSWTGVPLLIAGTVIFILGMLALDQIGLKHHKDFYRVPVFGTASVLMVLGAVVWEAFRQVRFPLWLLAIGNSSFSLYLSHVFVISAVGRVWAKTGWTDSMLGHTVFIIIAVIASVFIGLLSYRYLEKPLLAAQNKVLRRKSAAAKLGQVERINS